MKQLALVGSPVAIVSHLLASFFLMLACCYLSRSTPGIGKFWSAGWGNSFVVRRQCGYWYPATPHCPTSASLPRELSVGACGDQQQPALPRGLNARIVPTSRCHNRPFLQSKGLYPGEVVRVLNFWGRAQRHAKWCSSLLHSLQCVF